MTVCDCVYARATHKKTATSGKHAQLVGAKMVDSTRKKSGICCKSSYKKPSKPPTSACLFGSSHWHVSLTGPEMVRVGLVGGLSAHSSDSLLEIASGNTENQVLRAAPILLPLKITQGVTPNTQIESFQSCPWHRA